MRRLIGLAVALGLGAPQQSVAQQPVAQEHPPITPTRDVDVLYRIPDPNAGRALEQRMRFSAATARQRIDPPTPGLFVVMDFSRHRMTTVRPAERMALDMPAPASAPGAFTRAGTARVAGLDCTQWLTRDAAGEPTQVCITPDGVMLRAAAAGRLLLEATRVNYDAQDAKLFAVPDDYKRIAAPAP